MKTYAVRQKSTKLFIPRLPTGRKRGGSLLEPSAEREPRLFHNRRSAGSFLGNWLAGHHVRRWEFCGDDYVDIVKQPNRNKDDMEIVEFDLVEK